MKMEEIKEKSTLEICSSEDSITVTFGVPPEHYVFCYLQLSSYVYPDIRLLMTDKSKCP